MDGSTLTLNNAEITQGFYEYGTVRSTVWFENNSDIEIELIGENTIKGPDRSDDDGDRWSLGITAEYAPITISGDGALDVSGGAVLSEGRDDTYSFGIRCRGLTINGGSVTAAGSETAGRFSWSCGIDVPGDNFTINSGNVTATGGTVAVDDDGASSHEMESCGFYLNAFQTDAFTVNGGSVTAKGGVATNGSGNPAYSCGIGFLTTDDAATGVALKGGRLEAAGDTGAIGTLHGLGTMANVKVTVAPNAGEQISAYAGAGEAGAAAILGSPFAGEQEITTYIIGDTYFYSVASESVKTPSFKVENGELFVSYDDGGTWTSIGSIDAADGEDGQDGAPGEDGREIELRVDGGYIQWKYNTDPESSWKNLIALSALQGDKGDKGDPGTDGQDGEDGADGQTPYIGDNGNWWIGNTDTALKLPEATAKMERTA